MAKTNHKSAFTVSYAASLLELANEQKQAEAIRQELGALRQLVTENRTFHLFLADPAIGHAQRADMVNRVLGSGLSPLMHNFLGVVNEKGRMGAIVQIADSYDALLDEQLGKIDVDVTVASKLTAEQFEQVRQQVGAVLKKDAIVHEYVDESIIGGLIIRVEDRLMDASVRTQLDAMRHQLLAAAAEH